MMESDHLYRHFSKKKQRIFLGLVKHQSRANHCVTRLVSNKSKSERCSRNKAIFRSEETVVFIIVIPPNKLVNRE